MSELASLRTRLADLADVALAALPAMFGETRGLFSHKTVVVDGDYVNHGSNVLYSTVSLVGLLEQRRRAPDSVLALGRAMDGAHAAVAGGAAGAALANLVWASALAGDRRGEELVTTLSGASFAHRGPAELGQMLYGLVAGARAYPGKRDAALSAGRACARELLARFSPEAEVFRVFPRFPRRSLIEGRMSSFAAQVYPLHGLAALYLETGEPPPAAMGSVARRIVSCQGSAGQWWWLYSANRRSIVEGYPVYSVHQDGMAFLGLAELPRLGLGDHWDALSLGLDWLSGQNELGTDLVERDPPLIDRCIQRAGSDADGIYGLSRAGYARAVARSLAPRASDVSPAVGRGGFEVLQECRSYHLGWLLCAHALVERAATEVAGVSAVSGAGPG